MAGRPVPERPRTILILGPTGVGKSDFALDLALEFGGEIIGADSRQIYRRLEIGTAKPSPEARRRVPHHLVDFVDPADTFDLAAFQRLAFAAIREIQARGRVPFVVGGSMQYVRSLTAGWAVPEVPPDPAYRQALLDRAQREGPAGIYRDLLAQDPAAAEFVDPTNPRRIARALEVIAATGRPFSALRRSAPPEVDFLKIALTRDRADLYQRVDRRAGQMFEAGLLAEVAGLLAAGYHPRCPAFSSLGYREAIAVLNGELSRQEALDRLQFGTHRYIRQQYAWLRREPAVHWIDVTTGLENGRREARDLIRGFLGDGVSEIKVPD